jgi:hypothetical protein
VAAVKAVLWQWTDVASAFTQWPVFLSSDASSYIVVSCEGGCKSVSVATDCCGVQYQFVSLFLKF